MAITTIGKNAIGSLPAGSVLQVIQTVKKDTFATTNTSFTDITGLSVAITPSSTSNKILIQVQLQNNATYTYAKFFNLLRDSTSILVADTGLSNQIESSVYSRDEAFGEVTPLTFLDSPSSTSELTYKMQGSVQSSGELTINYTQSNINAAYIGRGTSTITAIEIAG